MKSLARILSAAGLALGLHGLLASFLLPPFLRWFAGT